MTERDLLLLQLAEVRGLISPDLARTLRATGGDPRQHLGGPHLASIERLAGELVARGNRILAGRYELLEKLGEGGMAVVFKARDLKLDRIVALKGLGRTDPEDLDRFIREARMAALVRHPNLVEVYDVLADGDHHFLTMQYVEGSTLRALIGHRPLRVLVGLLSQVADALHHAHREGLIHRDVKPDNMLVDHDGRAYLSDFGLARRLEGGTRLTVTGLVLGTPAYMSPEQALGGTSAVDARSDVYSLGASLYEILTGAPPFRAEGTYEILSEVIHTEPAPPSHRRPGTPRELEVICLKALDKDKGHRYASAAEFRDDLQRYLLDQPVRARPAGRAVRALRWVRRHPAHVVVALVLLLSAAGVAAGFGLMRRRVGGRAESERWMHRGIDLVKDHERDLGVLDREVVEARTREGLACFERAVSADPGFALARVWLARSRWLLGDRDGAKRELDLAVRIDADCSEGWYWRGLLASQEYRKERGAPRGYDPADGGLVFKPTPEPPPVAALRKSAQADFDRAIASWTGGEMPEADHARGILRFFEGDYAGANELLTRYVRRRPYDAGAREVLAASLVFLFRFEEALVQYEETLRTRHDHYPLWGCAVQTLELWSHHLHCRGEDPRPVRDKGAALFSKAEARFPRSRDFTSARALILARCGFWEAASGMDPSAALSEALALVRQEREDAEWLRSRGEVAYLAAKAKERRGLDAGAEIRFGIAAFDRALRLEAGHVRSLSRRASLRFALGDAESVQLGIADLTSALESQPDGATLRAARGFARAKLWVEHGRGGFQEAMDDLDRAVAIRPVPREARKDRFRALGLLGQRVPSVWSTLLSEAQEVDEAWALAYRGLARLELIEAGRFPKSEIDLVIRDCDAAVSEDDLPWFVKGRAHFSHGLALEGSGGDGRDSLRKSVAAMDEAVRRFAPAFHNLAARAAARLELWRAEVRRGSIAEETWKAAVADYTLCLEKFGPRYDALWGRAFLRSAMSNLRPSADLRRLALEDLEAAAKLAPPNWQLLGERGRLLVEEAKESRDERVFERAIADLDRALATGPGQVALAWNAGAARVDYAALLLERNRDPSAVCAEGLENFRLALRREPKLAAAHVWRAHLFGIRGSWKKRRGGDGREDFEAGLRECSAALELRPGYGDAEEARRKLLKELGRE